MGIFTFKWPHAAQEVYVTGTFDNWSKSEKLEKSGEYFEKTVTLPDASEKIYYKFVVDGNWTTDHTAAQEKDESGNENNVLKPSDIAKDTPAAAIMSSVGPDATTVGLAKDVPLEEKSGAGLPGTFPETPAGDLDKQVKVDPLPAAPGGVFPVKLAPGEKIPDELKGQSVTDNVTLDKESYEKSGGTGVATFSSVGPDATTTGLAAKVPLEGTVPEVVKESQEKAGVDAEASGVKSEVEEKAEVENELLQKVPEAPSTSEGTAGKGTEKSENDKTVVETVTATATAAGAAVLAAAAAAGSSLANIAGQASTQATAAAADAGTKLPDSVKQVLPEQAQAVIAGESKEAAREEVSPEVPAEVKESIAEAGKDPEAAANTTAVEEKKEVEAELLKTVKTVEATGDKSASEAAASKTEEVKEQAGKTVEAAKAAVNGGTEAKGVEAEPDTSKASSSKGPESHAAQVERKKKNRLSSMFGKIKQKVSGKDK